MKGILKFFPAALAVFALASCSENDMLGEKFATQQGQDLGDLIVTVDPLDNESVVTRSYRTGDWQDELPDGSKIRLSHCLQEKISNAITAHAK